MIELKPMDEAPKDGSCILLRHVHRRYLEDMGWVPVGYVWSEVRWMDDYAVTRNPPHWERWNGIDSIRSDYHIREEDAIAWMHVPPAHLIT